MEPTVAAALVWALAFAAIAFAVFRKRGRRTHAGAGTSGAIYDLLNEDRRKAIEIILEERAEARDPETVDGNLPELEEPKGRPR